jgi:glycosyltransferase involved in cell wall biosynthesis
MRPTVSVVIPTMNRGRFLAESLRSVLSQDVPVEVIVVRDAHDTEADSVAELRGAGDIKILRSDLTGASGGIRNLGLAAATGDWLLFLDDDDMVFPGSLGVLIDFAERRSLDIAAGTAIVVPEPTRLETLPRVTHAGRCRRWTWPAMVGPGGSHVRGHDAPTPQNSIFSRRVVDGVRWDDALRWGSDWLFAVDAFARARKVGSSRLAFMAYRQHSGQISRQRPATWGRDFFDEWSEIALDRHPELIRYRRSMAARREMIEASIAYEARQPCSVGFHTLRAGWNDPRALVEKYWWMAIAHSLRRGMRDTRVNLRDRIVH